MRELATDNVCDYLRERGRLGRNETARVELLAGGVSNVVFLITPAASLPFVLKQSRAQLRTKADWFSRIERIYREADAQRALSQVLPEGAVPAVLFEDRENYCYAMSAVRADHVVWKRQLVSGVVNPQLYTQAGSLLGQIHAGTWGQRRLFPEADDTTVFFELRVDPFYRRIAQVHPAIQPAIDQLIDNMPRCAAALVHADFSPKNLLVHPDGVTLVDHETVHYGDPAFDLGFFFSHLWLKAIALPNVRAEMIAGIFAAWNAYRESMSAGRGWSASRSPGAPDIDHRGFAQSGSSPGHPIEELSQRAVLHLAACLLSRVDGKSPVDYLTNPAHQQLVRDVTLRWFAAPPADFDEAFRRLSEEVIHADDR